MNDVCDEDTPCDNINWGFDVFYSQYSGNGQFIIGNGEWSLNRVFSFGNGDVIIKGNGPSNTNIITSLQDGNSLTYYECKYWRCYIGIENVTLSSNRTATDDVLLSAKGGTMLRFCFYNSCCVT